MDLQYSIAKTWQAEAIVSGRFRPQKRDTLELMDAILQTNLRGLLAAAEVADDHEYLAAQGLPAIDGHISVVSDKSLRLAERLHELGRPDGRGDDLDAPAPPAPVP